MRQPVPTCDITRKRYAARRLARDSCSVATRAAVARVITSQPQRNAMTPSATNTTSSPPTIAVNAAPTAAVRGRATAWAK